MIVSTLKPFNNPIPPNPPISFPFLWIDGASVIWMRTSNQFGNIKDICLRKGNSSSFDVGEITTATTRNVDAWANRMITPHTLELSNQ